MYYPTHADLVANMRAEDPRLRPVVREHSCQTCGDPTLGHCDICEKPTCSEHVLDIRDGAYSLDVCEGCLWTKYKIITKSCGYCGRTTLDEPECERCKADVDSARSAA